MHNSHLTKPNAFEMKHELIVWFGQAYEISKPILRIGILGVLVGIAANYIFHRLTSHRKDGKKKQMVIDNYREQYKSFKQEMIAILARISDELSTSDLSNQLQDPVEFREYFRVQVSSSQDRWHHVASCHEQLERPMGISG